MDIQWENQTLIIKQDKPPKKITGTRLAAILGLSPYTTPFEAFCDITHAYDFPFEDTIYTQAGKIIEPKQADYIEQLFENVTRPSDLYGEDYFNTTHGDFFSKETIFGGMWDYLEIINNKPIAVFEMKTAMSKKRAIWQEGIPEYYALQAALYAYLLGVDDVRMVATFLNWNDYQHPEAFIPNKGNTFIFYFKISERYPTFEASYIKPAIDWYNKHILTGISPEYTEKDLELVEKIKGINIETDNLMDLDKIILEINNELATNINIDRLKEYSIKLASCIYFNSNNLELISKIESAKILLDTMKTIIISSTNNVTNKRILNEVF